MLVKKYKSEVVSIVNPFSGIYTLEFKSLNGQFKYQPGQFLHLSLDSDYDGVGQWPESRCFSMQSSPREATLKLTYSVKGSFTSKMENQLKVGSLVWLKLPYGDLFTQKHNKTNTVFIAGGTGITPFLSLFSSQGFNEYINPKIYLGFKNRVNNIYHNYLNRSNLISSVKKVFYEDMDGVIDINMIFLENGRESDFFISGPPFMIKSFSNYLIERNVPDNQILTDKWE